MTWRMATSSERAASEVISVLLMVAVTIVLAAMVGSVMLNIVGDVDDNPIAGAQVEFDGQQNEVRVVYTATQKKGTTLDVKVLDAGGTEQCTSSIGEVGDEVNLPGDAPSCSSLPDGDYTVRVTATAPDGRQAVVLEKDGSL